MNKKIRGMVREIERRGGTVGISDAIPEKIAEQFLREVLSCPDCQAAASQRDGKSACGDQVTIDRVLAGADSSNKRRNH